MECHVKECAGGQALEHARYGLAEEAGRVGQQYAHHNTDWDGQREDHRKLDRSLQLTLDSGRV